jgi:iron complex outermembrane receptor protein
VSFAESSEQLVQDSSFVQDEISLTRTLQLTAGSKLLWNDVTDWEIQPSARTLWKLTPEQSLWAAASRSVRTPREATATPASR